MTTLADAAALGRTEQGLAVVSTVRADGTIQNSLVNASAVARPADGDLAPDRLRLLLREIFSAAGGTHDDWDEYDRVMAEQGRTAVLIEPTRVYGS